MPVADGLEQPLGIAFGADGALYVCDSHRGRVVRVDGNGTLAPVASGLHLPASLHLAPDGSLLVVDHWHDREGSIARIGGGRLSDGKIFAPSGVAVATDGSTYVSTFSPEQPVGRLAADGSMQPLG